MEQIEEVDAANSATGDNVREETHWEIGLIYVDIGEQDHARLGNEDGR